MNVQLMGIYVLTKLTVKITKVHKVVRQMNLEKNVFILKMNVMKKIVFMLHKMLIIWNNVRNLVLNVFLKKMEVVK